MRENLQQTRLSSLKTQSDTTHYAMRGPEPSGWTVSSYRYSKPHLTFLSLILCSSASHYSLTKRDTWSIISLQVSYWKENMETKGAKSNFRAHRAERTPGLTHFTSACCTEPPLYVKLIINPQQICAKRRCLAKHGLLKVGLDLRSAGSWPIVKAGLLK